MHRRHKARVLFKSEIHILVNHLYTHTADLQYRRLRKKIHKFRFTSKTCCQCIHVWHRRQLFGNASAIMHFLPVSRQGVFRHKSGSTFWIHCTVIRTRLLLRFRTFSIKSSTCDGLFPPSETYFKFWPLKFRLTSTTRCDRMSPNYAEKQKIHVPKIG
jgi:hypothetical protein